MKPVACFTVARPAEKAGSSAVGESPVTALVQRTTLREARTAETKMRCVRESEFMSGHP